MELVSTTHEFPFLPHQFILQIRLPTKQYGAMQVTDLKRLFLLLSNNFSK